MVNCMKTDLLGSMLDLLRMDDYQLVNPVAPFGGPAWMPVRLLLCLCAPASDLACIARVLILVMHVLIHPAHTVCLLDTGLFSVSSFQPSAKSFQNTFFHTPRLSSHLEPSPSPILERQLLPSWMVCSPANAIFSKSGPQTGEEWGLTPKPSLWLCQQVSIVCLRLLSFFFFCQ